MARRLERFGTIGKIGKIGKIGYLDRRHAEPGTETTAVSGFIGRFECQIGYADHRGADQIKSIINFSPINQIRSNHTRFPIPYKARGHGQDCFNRYFNFLCRYCENIVTFHLQIPLKSPNTHNSHWIPHRLSSFYYFVMNTVIHWSKVSSPMPKIVSALWSHYSACWNKIRLWHTIPTTSPTPLHPSTTPPPKHPHHPSPNLTMQPSATQYHTSSSTHPHIHTSNTSTLFTQ